MSEREREREREGERERERERERKKEKMRERERENERKRMTCDIIVEPVARNQRNLPLVAFFMIPKIQISLRLPNKYAVIVFKSAVLCIS